MAVQRRFDICPACGKRVAVKIDGTLWHHRDGRPEFPGSPWTRLCPWSGRKPEEATERG